MTLLTALTPHAYGTSTTTNFSVNISYASVHTSINLAFRQNLTSLQTGFSLPVLRAVLGEGNSTGASQSIQQALQSKTPTAQVRNLSLQVASTAWDAGTSTQWFNMTVSFDTYGIQAQKLSGTEVDMAWKAFALSSDLKINGVEINRIGKWYLANAADQVVTSTAIPSTLFKITYRADGRSATSTLFQSHSAAISTLDFSIAHDPLSAWEPAYNSSSNMMTWSKTLGIGLGMAAVRTITEAGETSREIYGLFYNLTGLVSAPGGSQANGDLIITHSGDILGSLMGITIVSTIAVGSGAFIYEKRSIKRPDRRRARR